MTTGGIEQSGSGFDLAQLPTANQTTQSARLEQTSHVSLGRSVVVVGC
jgi:hypothetical protein